MPLPRLAASVDIERKAGPEGPFFVLKAPDSHELYVVNEKDFALVEKLATADSYQALVEEGRSGGAQVSVADAERLVAELRARGMLEEPPARPPRHAPLGPAWRPPDFPRFRANLDLRPAADGRPLLFEVRIPGASTASLLNDVDLTIAGLMDGSRDFFGIVEAGKAAGIPMNPEHLQRFIRELAAYGLIENAKPLPMAVGQRESDEATTQTEASRQSLPPAEEEEREANEQPVGPDSLPPWAMRAGVAVASVMGLGVLLLGVRVPAYASVSCTLGPRELMPISSPIEGKLTSFAVHDEELVQRGQLLATVEDVAVTAELVHQKAVFERLRGEIESFEPRPSTAQTVLARKRLAVLAKKVAKLERRGEDTPQLRALVASRDQAAAKLAWMREVLRPGALRQRQAESRAVEEKLVALGPRSAAELRAPEDGVVLLGDSILSPGQGVRPGALLMKLGRAHPTRAVFTVSDAEGLPEQGDSASFRLSGSKVPEPGHIASVDILPGGTRVSVDLRDESRLRIGDRGQVRLRLGKQSLLGLLASPFGRPRPAPRLSGAQPRRSRGLRSPSAHSGPLRRTP